MTALSISLSAQTAKTIVHVNDVNGNPVEFATISFNDSITSANVLYSDSLGVCEFDLNMGQTYTVQVKNFGFDDLDTTIQIKESSSTFRFELVEKDFKIEGVTVTAVKERIKLNPEGFTLNINGDNSMGNNVSEILRKAPGVDLSAGSLSLLGSSVKVFIDNREVNFSAQKLLNYLNGRNANTIEKIDLIINPDASYGANFMGRVIKITTRRRKGDGYEISGYTSLNRNRNLYSPQASADFLVRKGNFTSYIDGGWYRSRKREFGDEFRAFEQNSKTLSFDEKSEDEHDSSGPYIQFRSDYEFNNGGILGLKFDYSEDEINTKSITDTDLLTDNVRDSFFVNDIDLESKIDLKNLNLNYFIQFKPQNSSLNFDFDIGQQNGQYLIDQDITTFLNEDTVLEDGTSVQNLDNSFDFTSGKIDFNKKYTNARFLAGVSLRRSKTQQLIKETVNTSFLQIDDFNDRLDYDEDILGLYTNLSGRHKKITYSLGLRYEYTNYNGVSTSSGINIGDGYSRLFPQAVLRYKEKSSTFTISYKERIRRPSFDQLIPFKRYSSPLYYYTGNPDLRAFFPRSIEFLYYYKNNLYFKVSNLSAKNSILEYNRNIPNSLLVEGTKQNNGEYNRMVYTLGYNKRFSKYFHLKSNIIYVKGESKLIQNDITETFDYDAYTITIVPSFNITDQLRLSTYYYYSSDIVLGVRTKQPYAFFDVDISYSFNNDNSAITLKGRDIFQKSITRYEGNYNNLIEMTSQDWGSRFFVVAFSHYFETEDVKSQRRRTRTANDGNLNRL